MFQQSQISNASVTGIIIDQKILISCSSLSDIIIHYQEGVVNIKSKS